MYLPKFVFVLVFVLSLPYDLNRSTKNYDGITKAIKKVIAAATAAIGIHTLTAVDALSSVGHHSLLDILGIKR